MSGESKDKLVQIFNLDRKIVLNSAKIYLLYQKNHGMVMVNVTYIQGGATEFNTGKRETKQRPGT